MIAYSFLPSFSAARSGVSSIISTLSLILSLGAAPALMAQEEPAPIAESETPAAPAETAPAEAAPATDPATPEAAPAEAASTIPVQDTAPPPAEAAAPIPEGATALDTIEVTGSRIKRTDFESESPILVINRDEIDRAGLVSIGDILQNLPQAGAALSRAFNNGGNGATEIDLRNLGSNRVLVLVNGRRWVGSVSQFNTSGVDLNTIPISVIDSIEILKDGASAVYGSDAIAGVINIKTRKDYVGAETRGHVEATEKGDGLSQLFSFASGTVAGKTSVFFDVSYVNQGKLMSGDRSESAVPLFGTGLTRGSGFSPFGRDLFVPTNDNANAINSAAGIPQAGPLAPCYDIGAAVGSGVTTGEGLPAVPTPPAGGSAFICDLSLDRDTFSSGSRDFIRFDVNDHAYNYAPINYLITPSERTSIFGQVGHQITDQVRFSSEVLYNVRKSSQQLAHTPLGCGDVFAGVKPFDICYVDSTNPYNPTNPQSPYYIPGTSAQDIGLSDPAAGLVGLGAILKRFVELGPRVFNQNVDTMRLGGGFDGGFDLINRLFSWDAGYAFTESKLQQTTAGLADGGRVARASGPLEDCIGIPDPSDPNAPIQARPPEAYGCVPLDWFGGPGTVTPEMLDYIRYTAIDVSRQNQKLAYGNISTEIGDLGGILPGPMGMAFGVEYRKEFFSGQPDPLRVSGLSSTNSATATRGDFAAKEAYLEFRAPLLADVTFDEVPGLRNVQWLKGRSFVQDLELSLAGRYSNYTGFGDNISGKAGIRYKPYEDLILRGTISDAFRAPSITDLFLGRAVSFPSVDDPCGDANRSANADINCDDSRGDGSNIPATAQATSQINTVFGGNPNLTPETARTLSAGFVYSPSYVPDFNIYLDWYSIELVDFISFLGPDVILDLCFNSAPDNRSFCNLQSRTATGQLSSIDATAQNFSALNVEGVDFNIDWILPLPETFKDFGTFQWVLDAAYVTKYEQVVPSAQGVQSFQLAGTAPFGGFGTLPRWKVNTGLNWRQNNWEATWNLRYIHHMMESCDDGRGDPGGTGGIGRNPTKINSLNEFGLCSDPNTTSAVLGSSQNELKGVFYNDLQGVYNLPNWNSKLSFGVNNVLDQDPPRMSSAFADSYDKATYDPWGSRTPYLRYQVNF